jgi:endoglucanase
MLLVLVALSISADALNLNAMELSKKMGVGWNLGDDLECCDNSDSASEASWGNTPVSKALIDAVKAAGFTTVRIPCAWSGHIEDKKTYKIKQAWLDRVQEVVDYVINNGMYAIVNCHWDGGWLELHPYYKDQKAVNAKQKAIWTQIANQFKNYDEHVLFAGCNEVNKGEGVSGDPTAENIEVHESYLQTFVDAVRATGGNNAKRCLVVQAFCTNIAYAQQYLKMPKDTIEKRLFAEVHYYDPWDFCGEGGDVYLWGKEFAGQPHCAKSGLEDHVDERFGVMKTSFTDKGIPVILGEYSVTYRVNLAAAEQKKHNKARCNWLGYVSKAAVKNGCVPCVWDNGKTGDKGCGLFDRKACTQKYPDAISAVVAVKAK